jgi:uncharacterized GH25 family protein
MSPLCRAAAILLFFPTLTFAHDYWLEPDSFRPRPDETLALRLFVGEKLTSEAERSFQKKPTLKFQLLSAKKTVDLLPTGTEDKTPVARLVPKDDGTYLIALERDAHLIKLDAKKFNDYLTEEGRDSILEARRKAGEEKTDGRERYRRYLKSLIQVGDRRDDTFKKILGQKLEIVPQANPYDLKPGDALPVLLLFEGKPLAGVRIESHCRVGDKVTTQTAVTGKDGIASVKLDGAGTWLVRLVHMRRCADREEADWDSFWASFSFGLK